MKGLSRFQIWLLKKVYRIPNKTPDFDDDPSDVEANSEDEIAWIEEPSQAETVGDFLGLLLISPKSNTPLDDARRVASELSQDSWGLEVAHFQFGKDGSGPLRFGEVVALPPVYLTVDEHRTITDWETFLPDRVPCYTQNPKKEVGMTEDEYSALFNRLLEENTSKWITRLREMADMFPQHFVVMLDCIEEYGSPITFTHEIRLKAS